VIIKYLRIEKRTNKYVWNLSRHIIRVNWSESAHLLTVSSITFSYMGKYFIKNRGCEPEMGTSVRCGP